MSNFCAGRQEGKGNKRASDGGNDVSAELACSEQLPSPSRQLSAGPVPEQAAAQPAEDEAPENIKGGFTAGATASFGKHQMATLSHPSLIFDGSGVKRKSPGRSF